MRALQASSFLVAVITGAALVLMVAGLAISARPELGETFGMALTSRDGLGLALASGTVAVAAALLGRVLNLLRDNLTGDDAS